MSIKSAIVAQLRLAGPHRCQNWIDLAFAPKHLAVVLRSLFLIALVLGAIIGLSGQAIAGTAVRCGHMAMEEPAGMSGMADCCPDEDKSAKDNAPCEDMAAACLAMAGCATIALHDGDQLSLRTVAANDYSWFGQNLPVLYGRTIPPDPYPPTRLD